MELTEERGEVISPPGQRLSRQLGLTSERGDVIGPPGQRPSQQLGLTPKRQAQLLAYCKLTELADDPEVQALIPVLYDAAVGYMSNAGVAVPDSGTARAAQYDLCVNYLVLNAWERREVTITGTTVMDNPVFRRRLNQLKWTERRVGI